MWLFTGYLITCGSPQTTFLHSLFPARTHYRHWPQTLLSRQRQLCPMLNLYWNLIADCYVFLIYDLRDSILTRVPFWICRVKLFLYIYLILSTCRFGSGYNSSKRLISVSTFPMMITCFSRVCMGFSRLSGFLPHSTVKTCRFRLIGHSRLTIRIAWVCECCPAMNYRTICY